MSDSLINILVISGDILFETFLEWLALTIFYQKRKSQIPKIVFLLTIIAANGLGLFASYLGAGITSTARAIVNTSLTFSRIFLLSFFFDAKLSKRFYCTFSIIIIILIGEMVMTFLTFLLPPAMETNDYFYEAQMTNLCNILDFLLLLLTQRFLLRRKKYDFDPAMIITPLATFIVFMLLTGVSYQTGSSPLIFFSTCALLLLNIMNYYMLYRISQYRELQKKNSLMKQQLLLQADKYLQLSLSFRNTRSVMHDTRKHLCLIQNALQQDDAKEADTIISEMLGEMERSYQNMNYGNLVIDSFLNLYTQLAAEQKINFQYNIFVQEYAIPLRDYDFSIVLGNLLDNSFHACAKLDLHVEHYVLLKIAFVDNEFVIHMENPMPKKADSENTEDLNHGYGIANIMNIVEKYNGIYHQDENGDVYQTTIIIPRIAVCESENR